MRFVLAAFFAVLSSPCFAQQTNIVMTGFSYYLGCNNLPSCWVDFTTGHFYNALSVGSNAKPSIVLDTLSEMKISTGGFTPVNSGFYETRMLMEATSGVSQTLVTCGWSSNPEVQPPYGIVMVETQGPSFYNNSHMTPLIEHLNGGTTYYMNCWANQDTHFNNLTVQTGSGITPLPVVDFTITRIPDGPYIGAYGMPMQIGRVDVGPAVPASSADASLFGNDVATLN